MIQTTDPTLAELVITRIFDAPRELVWQAWTDPKHLAQWWGPKGFNSSACEMDLLVGGRFSLDLCAPNGVIYPCKGTYLEIKIPERIVYSSAADGTQPCGAGLPPRSVVTVTFFEHQGKTTLTIHTRFESDSDREASLQSGYSTGWAQCLERLAGALP
jgi:uncharacterized protein YndB with AHSA1/START domain